MGADRGKRECVPLVTPQMCIPLQYSQSHAGPGQWQEEICPCHRQGPTASSTTHPQVKTGSTWLLIMNTADKGFHELQHTMLI